MVFLNSFSQQIDKSQRTNQTRLNDDGYFDIHQRWQMMPAVISRSPAAMNGLAKKPTCSFGYLFLNRLVMHRHDIC